MAIFFIGNGQLRAPCIHDAYHAGGPQSRDSLRRQLLRSRFVRLILEGSTSLRMDSPVSPWGNAQVEFERTGHSLGEVRLPYTSVVSFLRSSC